MSMKDAARKPRRMDELEAVQASVVRFVLFDIDDTITEDGRLPEESYTAIWRLGKAGLAAIPVTGRPAGWCDLIARQWPVDAVVGENGAFAFYMEGGKLRSLFHPEAANPESCRKRLEVVRERVLAEVPGSRVAKDQFSRLFDLAVDFAEEEPVLPLEAAVRMRDVCESMGARAKISSIHVNAWFGDYDKLSMAELYLSRRHGYDPERDRGSVVFFGDSPNDEPMFRRFPLGIGVANIREFLSLMETPPAYVTEASHGRGFAEGVDRLIRLRAVPAPGRD